jgi:hypothetical protein
MHTMVCSVYGEQDSGTFYSAVDVVYVILLIKYSIIH